MNLRSLVVAAFVLHSPVSLADVLVVDALGGGDFTAIQPAVDAASTGDILLVKPGSYAAFTIEFKGLSVMGDGPGVSVTGSIRIVNTLVTQRVVLAGLAVTGFKDVFAVDHPALVLDVARGPVRVEACTLTGGEGASCGFRCPPGARIGGRAVLASAGLSVSFVRCTITGGRGEVWFFDGGRDSAGGEGVFAVGSKLSFYDCEVRGGHGAEDPFFELGEGGDGGDAIVAMDTALLDAIVHLSGSVVAGGEGGDGDLCICISGDGGDGLTLIGASTRGYVLDSELSGGAAGCAPFAPTVPGQPLVELGGATTVFWPGEARTFSMPTPVREGEVVTLSFTGLPGDQVFLTFGPIAGFSVVPSASGVLLLAAPFSQRFMGVIPGSGQLDVTFGMPPVPDTVDGSLRYLQARFVDPSIVRWLASPSSFVLLNEVF